MMHRHRIVLATLFAVALAAPAQANKGLGFELYGGWSGYEMGELNDSLASFDALVGSQLGPIEDGVLAGGAFRFRVGERGLIRFGLEHWFAKASDDDLEFDVAVWAIPITATYWLWTKPAVRLGVGAGFLPYNVSGAFRGDGFEFDASGSGFAGQLTGEAEWRLGGPLSLTTVAGYRFAKADALNLDDQAFSAIPDYTGPWLRLGIAIDGQ